MRHPLLVALIALALPALVSTTAADAQTTRRVTGVVEAFDGSVLRLAARSGETVAVTIPADLAIGAVADRTLSDIHAGDYVGSAAMKGVDGQLHAQEVHIFTAAQRGLGEGHRPMDLPDQTMTNATVAEVAAASTAGVLRLKYKDGEQTILVGPEARVVAFVAGDRSLLVPGATVRVIGLPQGDGRLTARSVQAEKDGVKPLD
ncbi:hypothetical protein EYW49_08860 [Siculibacillus lacustris]|uniref:DUF5666 domain-containing protein n=1 Tax=Siculibacillus lacustris TaxID=1549641 RepID=A0A4V2KTV0_9HYPH|nr:hypothetical protein [Siculibacillus lacustris]TBW38790.1 hypothetical protein EYW49_08860 [Siculibacillus lacustris]